MPSPTEGGLAGKLPTFLVLGAMRSGTTTLWRALRECPDAFVAAEKEVHFFDRNFERGLDWYARKFRGAGSAAAIGEVTPNYLFHPEAIARAAEIVPAARLVVILRNPVDRAYSHYWHNVERGKEDLSFAEALEAEPARLARDTLARDHYSYCERGYYHRQLGIVVQSFPREQLLVLLTDELRNDPAATFDRLARHLGVSPTPVPEELSRRANRYVRFRSARLRNWAAGLPPVLRKVIMRLNTDRSDLRPPMQAATQARLRDLYAPGNRELAQWLGGVAPDW